jgi:hypothetical protein
MVRLFRYGSVSTGHYPTDRLQMKPSSVTPAAGTRSLDGEPVARVNAGVAFEGNGAGGAGLCATAGCPRTERVVSGRARRTARQSHHGASRRRSVSRVTVASARNSRTCA